jgi:hypothetical protein
MDFQFIWFNVKIRKSIDDAADRSFAVFGILAGKLSESLRGRNWLMKFRS